jgi:hypothetical protein
MAIIRDNLIETNSLFPDSDWYHEENEVIDETTEEGKALVEKILALAPAYKLVRDDDGKIIGAVDDPVKLAEMEQQNAYATPTLEERVRALEQMQQIMIAQKD